MARGPRDRVERSERDRMAAEETAWALRDANRAAVDVDYALARRLGLRPMDYTALSHVLAADGRLSPHELSTRLGISTGSTSELVDRLEGAGHLRRLRDHQDRRRVHLQPTEDAVRRVLTELGSLFAAVDDLAEEFSAPEREAIIRYLRRAAELMRDYGSESGRFTDPPPSG